MPHPKDLPLEFWTPGWLKLEVASLADRPDYILMFDDEKREANLPVTTEEMRDFIRQQNDDSPPKRPETHR